MKLNEYTEQHNAVLYNTIYNAVRQRGVVLLCSKHDGGGGSDREAATDLMGVELVAAA